MLKLNAKLVPRPHPPREVAANFTLIKAGMKYPQFHLHSITTIYASYLVFVYDYLRQYNYDKSLAMTTAFCLAGCEVNSRLLIVRNVDNCTILNEGPTGTDETKLSEVFSQPRQVMTLKVFVIHCKRIQITRT